MDTYCQKTTATSNRTAAIDKEQPYFWKTIYMKPNFRFFNLYAFISPPLLAAALRPLRDFHWGRRWFPARPHYYALEEIRHRRRFEEWRAVSKRPSL